MNAYYATIITFLIAVAFLWVKLKYIDVWNQRRWQIADFYLEQLHGLPGLSLPEIIPGATHVWHLFVISAAQRDQLQTYLEQHGVGTLVHYPIPPHLSPVYADLNYKSGDFPLTERIADAVLRLPMGPHFTLDDADYIVKRSREFLQR